MLFPYAYAPDDFEHGLPDEHGDRAYGVGGFQLALKAETAPTIVELNDNDPVSDEVDSSQTIAS
ncbi:hypothetical protein [Dinoroseobacter sp. S124A]|uniref:hypothetical protein n=1 Tax=Dinoroseobacter sp. S124A TaxID=3415128 RepID=UPI003C7ACA22